MATVVSVTEISKRFATLGWVNVSATETLEFITAQSIPAASLVAYLDAVIAAPAGLNDQTIPGCTGTNATKITNALKAKGVEAV